MSNTMPLESPRRFPAVEDFNIDDHITDRDRRWARMLRDEGLATSKEVADWWMIAWRYGLR